LKTILFSIFKILLKTILPITEGCRPIYEEVAGSPIFIRRLQKPKMHIPSNSLENPIINVQVTTLLATSINCIFLE